MKIEKGKKMVRKRIDIGRKVITMVLVFAMGFLLTGCQMGNEKMSQTGDTEQGSTVSGKEVSQNGKRKVVTTIFPYYDFVREIAGDLVDVTMIVPAGMDTHSFEPTAEDMITMGKADLLIYNGGEMETWVPKVVEAAENPELFTDAMMDYVDTFIEEHVEGMEEGDHHDDGEDDHDDSAKEQGHEGEIDEHIWTSPENARKIVAQIAKDLAQADPEHKDEYLENAQNYIGELEKLDEEFEKVTDKAKNRYLVFGDRFPLRYFVEEYDLEYTAAFSGCSSDTEPSAETIAYLTDQVKKRKLPVVLKIELTSSRVADSIAEASGAKVETFSTCHNVTKEEFDSGATYLGLMKQNISVLKDALEVE